MKINKNLIPQDQVFWYLRQKTPKQLYSKIKTNIVVIGGGMAGLSAAQSFNEKGFSVVLLEKNYCGSGASGKSSGFITPDSELDLTFFNKKFGSTQAKKIWDFVLSGVSLIESNIKNFSINCDYSIEDTFVVANSKKSFAEIEAEHHTRKKLSYESSLYNKADVPKILGTEKYFGGVRYKNTFGIDAYLYCQSMKDILQKNGVQVFEESPAIRIHSKGVDTFNGSVEADHIIVCVDRFLPNIIKKLNNNIFHAQTFLMLSAPLQDDDIKKVFPQENLMVWDTDLIYTYYRVIEGNRFLIGGADLMSIFWGHEQHHNYKIFKKLYNYSKQKFSDVKMNFEYFWPGLIGVSKDIMPIADNDKDQKNIYYISAAAGLPWASALGKYAAERIVDNNKEMDKYFSIDRKFPVDGFAQKILGKRLTFAISNLLTLK